ncbi:MAG: hypothetical protein ABW185_10535 [Sedimenticola sp.]
MTRCIWSVTIFASGHGILTGLKVEEYEIWARGFGGFRPGITKVVPGKPELTGFAFPFSALVGGFAHVSQK